MKYFFITGIPAAGKSFLADKISKKLGILHVKIDDLRKELTNNPRFSDWVNFFYNQDEKKYYQSTSCEKQWENIKNQSEAIWPEIKKKINEVIKTGKPAIFEAVNLLPHLIKRDFDFPGIILLGNSIEEIFERNKKAPRWGNTEELQKIEAEAFFNCEGGWYKKEAEKFGFKVFRDSNEAEKEILKYFQ